MNEPQEAKRSLVFQPSDASSSIFYLGKRAEAFFSAFAEIGYG